MITNNNKSNFQKFKDSFSRVNLKSNYKDAIINIFKVYAILIAAVTVFTILSKPLWWIMKIIWLAL